MMMPILKSSRKRKPDDDPLLNIHLYFERRCGFHTARLWCKRERAVWKPYLRKSAGRLIVLLLLSMVSLFPFSAAYAHATVVRAEPPDNAVLPTSPNQISLWFNEPISPQFTTVQVVNGRNEPIQAKMLRVDATQNQQTQASLLVVALPDLPDGVYNLLWKTLSELDGHVTQGHVVFGVGAAADTRSMTADLTTPIAWGEVLLRWLSDGTLIALIGAMAIIFLILEPALRFPSPERATVEILLAARLRVWTWAVYMALLGLCSGVATLAWQTANTTLAGDGAHRLGNPLLQRFWQLISQTRWGSWWLVREALYLLLLVVLYQMALSILNRRSADPGKQEAGNPVSTSSLGQRVLLSGLAIALAVSVVSSGHAAALLANPKVAIAAVVLHVLAASVWVGGLVALSIGLLPGMLPPRRDLSGAPAPNLDKSKNFAGAPDRSFLGDRTYLLQHAWRPFGRWALLSVACLLATGLYSTGRQVASLDAALTTLYGRALSAKLLLMLAVGALGLINHARLRPSFFAPIARLLRRPADWQPLSMTRLPILLLGEVILGLLVLLATGVVTSSAPAHGPQFEPNAHPAPPNVLSQYVDHFLVTAQVQPNQAGVNRLRVQVGGQLDGGQLDGGQLDGGQSDQSDTLDKEHPILRVIARFRYTKQEIGSVSAQALPIAPGVYEVSGSQFSIAGPWRLQIVIRRKGLEDRIADFPWTVDVPTRPVVVSNRPIEPLLTLAAMIVFLLSVVTGALQWLWHRRRLAQPLQQVIVAR